MTNGAKPNTANVRPSRPTESADQRKPVKIEKRTDWKPMPGRWKKIDSPSVQPRITHQRNRDSHRLVG